ncbi:hypothetical protein FSP39_020456 [Pinctada imbricata]|uniref:Uncharacterized protein n=1 Tax=Pinctada imbricata TaxID=66713 RepID=A0AA88YM44_PINIB|nr:hypothetical protein FSP39_020456 [Pinctada imbricata]
MYKPITAFVDDLEYLLPVRFREIPCSGCRGEVENASANQPSEAVFADRSARKHKLGRGSWVLFVKFCAVVSQEKLKMCKRLTSKFKSPRVQFADYHSIMPLVDIDAYNKDYVSPLIENLSPPGHVHCSTCRNLRCPVPVDCEMIPCKEGCPVMFHSCKEEDHLKICRRAEITCPIGCGQTITRKKFAQHFTMCTKNDRYVEYVERNDVRPCVNGCNKRIKASAQKDHDLLCKLKRVPCINAPAGCEALLLRKEKASHLPRCPAAVNSLIRPDIVRRDEFTNFTKMRATLEDAGSKECYMCHSDFTLPGVEPVIPSGSMKHDSTLDCPVFVPSLPQCDDRLTSDQNIQDLPGELLLTICGHLDSLSLYFLSMTCRRLRDICQSLLQERGMVSLRWKDVQEGTEKTWTPQDKVWTFSKMTTPVIQWKRYDPEIYLRHVTSCEVNKSVERVVNKEPFALVPMDSNKDISTSS